MVVEEIEKSTDALNSSRHLTVHITRSLARLRGPQKEVSSPKFHTLCEILGLHLRMGETSKIAVFGESQERDLSLEAHSRQCVMTRLHESLCVC